MEYKNILYQDGNGKATLTLNRPRALNALNRETIDELLSAVKKAAEDPGVKVLILTGTGRAFCFGADLSEFSRAGAAPVSAETLLLLEKSQEIIRLLAGMPKPTIAALNGFAAGLGLDLALGCDLRIAAERARLAEAFTSMGLIPDGGGTFFLPRLVGLARAAEMIFTGEPVGSAEAERIGLVNRVVPNDQFPKAVADLADKLVKRPSLAIGLAKQVLRKNLEGDLDSALRREAQGQKICLASGDHREAVRAFLEKRPPVFEGR
jgi:2-(1,2-epoxy-1,2-dihydrophenyl)acetyl-CoA isomerase